MERTIPKRKDQGGNIGDIRVRRSRDGLRRSLLDLLKDQSFDDITVRGIVDHADVGYTTFFRHFASKEALLDAVIAAEIECLTERALPIYDADDALGACRALCAYVDEHRPLWSALLTGGAAPKVREEMLNQSRRVASARGADQALPPDLGTRLFVAIMLELFSWWLRQPDPWPVGRIAEILYQRAIAPTVPAP